MLYLNWELVAPYVEPGISNPFAGLFLLKGRVPGSPPEDPRYQKSWWDLAFLAYYVVFFSFVRETLAAKVSRPLAKYFGLKRESKIDRFAEQAYAVVYFMVSGTWGYVRCSSCLRLYLGLTYLFLACHVPPAYVLVQHKRILARLVV